MTISVVIPAYNEAATIEACLQALRQQTRQADEIILVDNNSIDDTAHIARQCGARVITEPQQGIMPAAHAGYQHSTGDIIARCDADSIVPVDWLQRIEQQLQAHPEAVAITGPGTFYDTHWLVNWWAQVWYMYAYFISVGSAIAQWPLFGSNCAIRRTAWLKIADDVHRTRADIHDDIDLSMHLSASSRVLFVPSLTVGISARSLRVSNLPSRYRKGLRSLSIHWPAQAPWQRWRQRL
ncbi:MAG TPA: glycosyltransferase family 2 protein [Candidatus Saccharimonadales bacterium]|jgi:glycosyltransferase involved in cell wall biosynthesis